MLLLAAPALALPPGFEPDLSFQQTTLRAPTCTPGQSYTWEITEAIETRTHGEDVRSQENIDTERSYQRHYRVRLACIDAQTHTLTQTSRDASGGWQEAVPLPIEGALSAALPLLFPPMVTDPPQAGQTWDGAWPLDLGPWWDCHGAVTAGADPSRGAPREYTLSGRCEQISYWGHSRLSGTFTRHDGGFGVQSAAWQISSTWEHYMVYSDLEQTVTVTRIE